MSKASDTTRASSSSPARRVASAARPPSLFARARRHASPCWPAAPGDWTAPVERSRRSAARLRRTPSTPPTHAALDQVADRIEDELGEIDVWVNVAFTSVFARFVDIEPEEFERVTQVTYLGFVNGTRSALRRMLPRDRGTIVQVGSTLGLPRHPPAERLLRRQARHAGVPRVAAHRAAATRAAGSG